MARMEVLAMLCTLAAGCGGMRRGMTGPPAPPASPGVSIVWMEPFDELNSSRWRNVEVRGNSQYRAVSLDGRSCLRAESHATGSILLTTVRFEPKAYPWLMWQWRVDQLVQGEALDQPKGSDAAARVYVYFETQGLPWQKRNIDYVWSASLPVGTSLTSAYSPTSHIVVVESGADHAGQWRDAERNLAEDYRESFHEEPPGVIAIGLMTDSDNTGSESLAYFDEVRIGKYPSRAGTAVEPARAGAKPAAASH